MEKRKILVSASGIVTCCTAAVFGGDRVDLELTADFMGVIGTDTFGFSGIALFKIAMTRLA